MGHRRPFSVVPRKSVTRYGPEQEPPIWRPGDFILTHGDALTSRVIRWGQALRIHGADRIFTYWNHAALVVSEDGDLIESLGRGVSRTTASKYKPKEYHLVDTGAAKEDREQAVKFANYSADHNESYGFATIVSIAFTLLTGGKFSFYIDGTEICSGLVARAQERTGAIFNREPSHVMPADLGKYYNARPDRHSDSTP